MGEKQLARRTTKHWLRLACHETSFVSGLEVVRQSREGRTDNSGLSLGITGPWRGLDMSSEGRRNPKDSGPAQPSKADSEHLALFSNLVEGYILHAKEEGVRKTLVFQLG